MKSIDPTSAPYKEVRNRFHEDGYVVIPNLLSSEALGELRQRCAGLDLPCPGELHGFLEADPESLELLDLAELLTPVITLLGSQIHLIHSSITSIPPKSTSMSWHEDGPRPWSYPAVDGVRPLILLRVGIALSPPSEGNHGNLVVIPGSHKHPFPHPDEAEALWDHPDVTPVEVPEGGAVLFHNGLWHSTAPNDQDTPQRKAYWVFAPLWHKSLDYITPPIALLEAINALPEHRHALLRQLVGCIGEEGPVSAMFPSPEDAPLLTLLEPDIPASGA